jgi:hypothetical protein
MILVDLLVVETGGLVAVSGRVAATAGGIVAVRAEELIGGRVGGGERRVGEADCLGVEGRGGRGAEVRFARRGGGEGLGVGKVGGERGVVGVGEGVGGCGGGEAVELGGEVRVLLVEGREGVGDGLGIAKEEMSAMVWGKKTGRQPRTSCHQKPRAVPPRP